MECNFSSQNPTSITSKQLPAISIRYFILGFDQSFDITTRSIDISHQSRALWWYLVKFFPGYCSFKAVQFVWKCIGTLSLCFCATQFPRQLPVATCTRLIPIINPLKLKPNPGIQTKVLNYQNFLGNLLHDFSFWNLRMALVDFRILNKRYIT